MKCIYVAIGQKESKIASIVRKLEETGAMEYTTVVLAGASTPCLFAIYFSLCRLCHGEYFLDKGEDVLVL